LAKRFLQGGPKNSKKIRIFDHLQTLRISATAKNSHISSVRTFLTVPVPPGRNPVKPCPKKAMSKQSNANGGFVSVLLTYIYILYLFR